MICPQCGKELFRSPLLGGYFCTICGFEELDEPDEENDEENAYE